MLLLFVVWLGVMLRWVVKIELLDWRYWAVIVPATIFFMYFQYRTDQERDEEDVDTKEVENK